MTPIMGVFSFIAEIIFRKFCPSLGSYILISFGGIFDSAYIYTHDGPFSMAVMWGLLGIVGSIGLLLVIDGSISTKVK